MDARDLTLKIKADKGGKKEKKQPVTAWEKAAQALERAPKKKKWGKK